ncbi:M3B subfamily peptidase [Planococcus antarcticus DSM 14505]|uniref:M3B subfamily peptidase n=1 Tax=Planococcus antarcticus DSM 14505 TaxID=1185653 RepID=A0AA87LTP4_9BACL|nr:M3 family oligoendopeptidase [Planococcus antarcticus]EIM08336.1 M3B subfamily peptidase [Planococcus antarcticus DSM 14505]
MKEEVYLKEWNLTTVFKGGSDSPQLVELMEKMQNEIQQLSEEINYLSLSKNHFIEKMIERFLRGLGHIQLTLSQVTSFITCLLAENPKEKKAVALQGKNASVKAAYSSVLHRFQQFLSSMEQTSWNELLETESLKKYRFILSEWRENANSPLSTETENVISDLMVDGYHAWSDLYRSIVNNLRVTIELNGTKKEYSVGQATNLRSSPDKEVREKAFLALEKNWTNQEETMSRIINHITGFRLQTDKSRGTLTGLQKPLRDNRITEETLQAMWKIVTRHKQPFVDYLDLKAKLAGNDQMPSYDFWAPFRENSTSIGYQEAVEFILQQFHQFGPELESFARSAFEKGWIEAANRPDKAAVAFCAGFSLTDESRVFLTYDGSMTSILTLAHELGHAFHNEAMKSADPLNRQYGMTTAETASTFTEMIVLDAAIKQTESADEKLSLLDEKIKRSVMNFMNLHSRFLFEERLYETRKEGMVAADQLNEMMQDALTEGYAGSISDLPIHSWISTPHFYITSSPFYNFPYTFGYLFSVSLYAKALEEGKEFEQRYLALLRDTGKMTVEELAMKHLGEDITQEGFWEKGMALCVKDAEDFIRVSSLKLVT